MWKVLNFEWVLLLKIKTNYEKMSFEGKMSWVCSHLGPTTHVTLSIHEGKYFVLFCCNDISQPTMSWGMLWNLSLKTISMNRGTLTWFRMFGTIVWNLLIIEPFVHWFFWKTKIENYVGIWGFFGIIGKPSPSLI
jgi:hypothetical protein